MEETYVGQRAGLSFNYEWVASLFLWGRALTVPAAEAAAVWSVLK